MGDLPAIISPYFQSSGAIAVLAVSLFGVYYILRCVYQLYFSPLSSVPGPWHTCISNLWITSHVLRMQKAVAIQQLFDIYGPVVRIGPGKVAFRDYAAMKDVYISRKFDKSEYYESFVLNDDKHTFCVLEKGPHAIHRKKYASHYTLTNLLQFQPEIYEFTHELVDGIYGFAKTNTPIECLTMVRRLMIDVLVTSHGYNAGSLKKWAAGVDDPLSMAIHDFPLLGVVRNSLPDWMWPLVSRIPTKRWYYFCTSDKIIGKFVITRINEMRVQLAEGKLDSSNKWMVAQLLEREGTPAAMSQTDIISETVAHMIAGSDTTSISLSYSFWILSQRSDIMHKLRQEIDQVMPDSRNPPDINTLKNLPYLNAFLKEALRLFGAVPSILERVAPPDSTYDLMGYSLPPGTVVGTQAWSMHRDPLVFPDPSRFEPKRWLETPHNRNHLIKMHQHFMAFGLGSRVCVGQRLATIVMRIAIASIVRNFDIIAPPETTQKSMAPKESFVIFPASMECRLNFIPRI